MARRKVKKTTKRRLTVFGTLSVILIFYFIFTLCFQGYNVYKLYNQKNSLKEKYSSLKTKAEDLKIEINQLHDPEYLAKYARENYSYSKEGEYIIKLNDTKEKIDKLDNSIKTPMKKKYKIIESKIGQGSFSQVLLAIDKSGHKYAIKRIKKKTIFKGQLFAN